MVAKLSITFGHIDQPKYNEVIALAWGTDTNAEVQRVHNVVHIDCKDACLMWDDMVQFLVASPTLDDHVITP